VTLFFSQKKSSQSITMNFFSHKEQINVATPIKERPYYDAFMSTCNQIMLCSKIYNLHKENNSTCPYLQFRSIVPNAMNVWAINKNINDYTTQGRNTGNILDFINRQFLKENFQFYDNPRATFANSPDVNIFKSSRMIGIGGDHGDLMTREVAMKDMLVEDIRNVDVWRPINQYISTDHLRNKNRIPVNQTAMNKRNYDPNPGGYRQNVELSSLENVNSGYNMSGIIRKSKAMRARENR
jgi:hypothetical protein